MKQTVLLLFFLAIFSTAFAQIIQWSWVNGDKSVNQYGVYGTKGVANNASKPGGRQGAVGWIQKSPNYRWIFGGRGNSASSSGYLNDLWRYEVALGQWTWMSGSNAPSQKGSYGVRGVASPDNVPGNRTDAFSFTDASGNFWLFGGEAYSASGLIVLNDLWKYTPSINQWTWMSGDSIPNQPGIYGVQGTPAAANKPGARSAGAAPSQIDPAGNLWIYGGVGFGSSGSMSGAGELGDLWKYSIQSGQWTWVSGASVTGEAPVYGAQGVAAAANRPGARQGTVGWTDESRNFYIFGGSSGLYSKNDLWRFDVSAGLWTWLSGSTIGNQEGSYGTKGIGNNFNTPGARRNATAQREERGNLILFGGFGLGDNSQNSGYLQDLWYYSLTLKQWVWLNGDNTVNSSATYGLRGQYSEENQPGARGSHVSWIDDFNTFYIFGGSGLASTSAPGYLNDFWQINLGGLLTFNGVGNFTAQKEFQAVVLNWTSSQDPNILSFDVERFNGTVAGYQSIGTVPATASTHYSFTDNTPLQGTNFYRIRLVDQAGSATYSSTSQVVMDQYATQFSVYQNPVQNVLQLVIQLPAKQKLTTLVRDMNGHVLIQREQTGFPGQSSFTVPVGHLSKGAYLIEVRSKSINSTKTFIKQ